MSEDSREARLARTFVLLADSLTSDFDLVDVLQILVDACADLLDTEAAGLMLADGNGRLQLMVSTSEAADLVEVAQLGARAGPCFESFATGRPVTVADIRDTEGEWPEFRAAALERGFLSVHATPMRLRDQVIGSMNLFGKEARPLAEPDIAVAQALTDVATIGILQERSARESRIVREQLQLALESRIVIEQAKGVLAQQHAVSMEEAFRTLRSYARSTSQPLRAVATSVVERRLRILPGGGERVERM